MQIKKKVETESDNRTVMSSTIGTIHITMMILVISRELVTTINTRITNLRPYGQGNKIWVDQLH